MVLGQCDIGQSAGGRLVGMEWMERWTVPTRETDLTVKEM
jgi:hypothetical protein